MEIKTLTDFSVGTPHISHSVTLSIFEKLPFYGHPQTVAFLDGIQSLLNRILKASRVCPYLCIYYIEKAKRSQQIQRGGQSVL